MVPLNGPFEWCIDRANNFNEFNNLHEKNKYKYDDIGPEN